MTSKVDRKVFCIGLGKTGTTTFAECMRFLGYSHFRGPHAELLALFRLGEQEELFRIVDQYESFDDYPWPFLYKTLAERYPNSYFVLTRRRNGETWYKSLCKHFDRRGPTEGHKLAYDCYSPYGHEDRLLSMYEHHLREVRTFFSGQQNFAELCWEEGDGWAEIAQLLRIETPTIDFPNANSSMRRSDKEVVKGIVARGNYSHALYYTEALAKNPKESQLFLKDLLEAELLTNIGVGKRPSFIIRRFLKAFKMLRTSARTRFNH